MSRRALGVVAVLIAFALLVIGGGRLFGADLLGPEWRERTVAGLSALISIIALGGAGYRSGAKLSETVFDLAITVLSLFLGGLGLLLVLTVSDGLSWVLGYVLCMFDAVALGYVIGRERP